MIYINIYYSATIFILLMVFTYLINGKLLGKIGFNAVNLITSLTFTLVYVYLREADSNDYAEYALKYISTKDVNAARFEFGYNLLVNFYKEFNISFYTFYINIILLSNFVLLSYSNLIMKSIKVNNFLIFPLLFYCSLYINFNFILLRTFIACGFFVAMIYYIIQKDYKQYIFLVLSIAFHYLVIPAIVIVYLAKFITSRDIKLFENFKFCILILIVIIISINLSENLAVLYIKYIDIYFPRFIPYNSIFDGWFDGYRGLPTTQLVTFILCLYIGNLVKINSYNYKIILNIIMLSFLILILFPFPKINSRLFLYFLPVYFILFIILQKFVHFYGIIIFFGILIFYFISNYV